MNKYAGTQTEKNLQAAFAGESQARNKYTYFASKAKKEGFEQIAELLLKTADNEKEHAKLWFKELEGIGTTAENLAAAAAGVDRYRVRADDAIRAVCAGIREFERGKPDKPLPHRAYAVRKASGVAEGVRLRARVVELPVAAVD